MPAPTPNTGAAGASFYTPAQEPPSGTALGDGHAVPTVFSPLDIRGVRLPNRFVVSPMCQYSADHGRLTDYHLVHLGQFALRGVGLALVEATAVASNGRISPEDSGLWEDAQVAPLRRVVDFYHSQNHLIGIQLAHAGRKASTLAPWLTTSNAGDSAVADASVSGWPDDVWAPSAVPFSDKYLSPKALSVDQIKGLVKAFVDSAKRAVEAGVDVIEIHGAHGYLLTSFLSPLSNHRTDEYGGSFENRTRFLIDVIRAVRAVIPDKMPLFVRISATEWMEWDGKPSWDLDESIRLAKLLPDLGVDLLDVSSGGNSSQQRIVLHPYYQVSLAGQIRRALEAAGQRLLIGAVGLITTAVMAKSIVEGGCDPSHGCQEHNTVLVEDEHGVETQADVVLLARQFLREPEFVLRAAHQLDVPVKWQVQYHRAGWRKGTRV